MVCPFLLVWSTMAQSSCATSSLIYRDFCNHKCEAGVVGKATDVAIAANRLCAPVRCSTARSAGNRIGSPSGGRPTTLRAPGVGL
jgi:hypothetical protein